MEFEALNYIQIWDLHEHESFWDKDHPTDNDMNSPHTENNESHSIFW